MRYYLQNLKAVELHCLICGIQIEYKGGRYRKTCSPKCKNKFDNKYVKKDKVKASCEFCFTEFETVMDHQRFCSGDCRLKSAAKNNQNKSSVYFYSCSVCHTQFSRRLILRGIAVSNGVRCSSCRKQLEKMRYRRKTIKRQKAIAHPKISVELIARRDNYICHLCDEPVDMDVPRTERLGATLDHIKPLSKGGLDTMENVALAHRICNIKKGNKYES